MIRIRLVMGTRLLLAPTKSRGASALLLWAAALAVATVAGCTSGSPEGVTKPSSSSGAAAVWRDFVACAREHGQQNMPDAVVDEQGRAQFPVVEGFNEKEAYRLVREPCGTILDRLPPQANPLAVQPADPEQMEVLRRYVQCLRDNGMPDMPDPGPNGEIRDPDRYAQPPLRQTRDAARNACDSIILEEYP